MASETGLRERKKALSRQAIHAAAVKLFLKHGYETVTVAQVAAVADVAVTTLFRYFPDGKDALPFRGEEDRGAALTAAIRERDAGLDAFTAISDFMRSRGPFVPGDKAAAALQTLIAQTPPLRAYARKKWLDCEAALGQELSLALKLPDDAGLRALARFILETPDIAAQQADPPRAIIEILGRLRAGWLSVPENLPH